MNEQKIDRKLKTEIEFFKMFIILIMGLVAGNINLLSKYIDNKSNIFLFLLILGIIFLIIISIFTLKSIITIKKLTNK